MDDQRTDRESGRSITPEEAQQILHAATWDDDGTFIQLRLGINPGRERITQLRRAIYVLWLYWKDQPALPFTISADAANIMRMRGEADSNLSDNNQMDDDLITDLNRLEYGAYCLLIGADAESEIGCDPKHWHL
jgi:hypothetical protein